jgi:hypothetical protein
MSLTLRLGPPQKTLPSVALLLAMPLWLAGMQAPATAL